MVYFFYKEKEAVTGKEANLPSTTQAEQMTDWPEEAAAGVSAGDVKQPSKDFLRNVGYSFLASTSYFYLEGLTNIDSAY